MIRFALALTLLSAIACGQADDLERPEPPAGANLETATFGGGCFWCVEAILERLDGVYDVVSGYAGGQVENPTYRQVCSGTTGHAEVCQLRFDPERISYNDLLEVFFKTHDPTTRDRQGADVGPQYRSIVLYHSPEQKEVAEKLRDALQASGLWADPIVTEIEPYLTFYEADEGHQDYFDLNGQQPYCRAVIEPKIEKFLKEFAERARD